jgi:hypothetical protein
MLDYKKITIFLTVLLIFSIGGFIFILKNTKSKDVGENSESTLQKTLPEIIAKVGMLMILPLDEEPTMATVSNPEKLKDQAFFANASSGDIVLIYSKAGKAILYNPTENKIVEVSPINLRENQSATSSENIKNDL